MRGASLSENENLKRASVVLAVDNLQDTLEWYADKLGFAAKFTWGEPAFFAIVQRDHVAIHLSEREDTSKPIAPSTLYVFCNDVDALYEEYHRNEVEMFQPPQDMEYGMREVDVRDVNGHFLTFGQER